MRREPCRGQSGLTLVEVLIVGAILAVLAGGVILVLAGAVTNARESACDEERRLLRTAVQSYRTATGYLPANPQFLVDYGYLDSPSSRWTYEPPVDLLIGEPTYVPTAECDV